MSIVADQIRRVDAQLDRLQLSTSKSNVSSPLLSTHHATFADDAPPAISDRIDTLQSYVKALSATSSSNPQLSSWRVLKLLDDADLSQHVNTQHAKSPYETELEWLVVSKATIQTYGLLLNTVLEQTLPLSNDIWYWDEVLSSYTYTGLYTIQTSPIRFWNWSNDIYKESRRRFHDLRTAPENALTTRKVGDSLSQQWRQFYTLVQESIRDRSVADLQRRVLSPVALCRAEARQKQAKLKKFRELSASGLGVLMDEALDFEVDDEVAGQVITKSGDAFEWKKMVERSIALMDTVLQNITSLETGIGDFEEEVFATARRDPELSVQGENHTRPGLLSKRLCRLLQVHVPNHVIASNELSSTYGRPSRLTRYWLPTTVALLSSTTVLRILLNRKAEILTWIQDFGSTIRDFWLNWVVEPTRKVVGTIRHDRSSEVAIMSKESLKGDRESLERMVVDFAVDRPEISTGNASLDSAQIAEIRAKVKEGDLTPVLRAYEKDLRSPFVGTVRGDLVRTLLIQVQKTKVDVEVAISGIDALLKSQELVFGFVGLTPGLLISFLVFRYLASMSSSRHGYNTKQKAGQTVRILRNIDRVLTQAIPTDNGMLGYKDHGLLLCEVHLLRERARALGMRGEIEREFLEDVYELGDIGAGVEKQLKVVQRIRWAYWKWFTN